jgi:phosphatidylserine decarboxylase
VEQVTYISGDTWNVNPIALKRVEKLFCKNERAVIETRLAATGDMLTLVTVAAILVASIRLHCLSRPIRESGRSAIPCSTGYRKGDEMGWFEHGSTIVVLAPETLSLADTVQTGAVIRQGQPLLRPGAA